MSKRHFYLWMLWHLCFLCLGVVNIYRYIVREDEIAALICGSILIPISLYGIYRVIEGRNVNEKERTAGE